MDSLSTGAASGTAQAVVFLLWRNATFINEANLMVDGGLDIALFYDAALAVR